MSTPAPRSRKRSTTTALPAEIKAAVAAAQDKKAQDVVLLDLRQASAFTDYFVICTGANIRQVLAIADAVEAAVAKKGNKPTLVEGAKTADWVLMDYFDFVVHIFTPATREFYGLERLWADAQRIEVPA